MTDCLSCNLAFFIIAVNSGYFPGNEKQTIPRKSFSFFLFLNHFPDDFESIFSDEKNLKFFLIYFFFQSKLT